MGESSTYTSRGYGCAVISSRFQSIENRSRDCVKYISQGAQVIKLPFLSRTLLILMTLFDRIKMKG